MGMNVVDVLEMGRGLISDEKNWTRKAYARDSVGTVIEAEDPEAVCWCSVGALKKVTSNCTTSCTCCEGPIGLFRGSFELLDIAVQEFAIGENMIRFNDTHTHAGVLAVWDRAIELAKVHVESE